MFRLGHDAPPDREARVPIAADPVRAREQELERRARVPAARPREPHHHDAPLRHRVVGDEIARRDHAVPAALPLQPPPLHLTAREGERPLAESVPDEQLARGEPVVLAPGASNQTPAEHHSGLDAFPGVLEGVDRVQAAMLEEPQPARAEQQVGAHAPPLGEAPRQRRAHNLEPPRRAEPHRRADVAPEQHQRLGHRADRAGAKEERLLAIARRLAPRRPVELALEGPQHQLLGRRPHDRGAEQ